MPSQEYDNTNRGALWIPRNGQGKARACAAGKLNIGGADLFATFCPITTRSEKAPTAKLFLETTDGLTVFSVSLFPKTGSNPANLYSGSIMVGAGQDFWVNIWKSDKRQDNSPELTISVQPKQPREAQPVAPAEPPADDDIPF